MRAMFQQITLLTGGLLNWPVEESFGDNHIVSATMIKIYNWRGAHKTIGKLVPGVGAHHITTTNGTTTTTHQHHLTNIT